MSPSRTVQNAAARRRFGIAESLALQRGQFTPHMAQTETLGPHKRVEFYYKFNSWGTGKKRVARKTAGDPHIILYLLGYWSLKLMGTV